MPKKEALCMRGWVIHNRYCSCVVDNLARGSVEKIWRCGGDSEQGIERGMGIIKLIIKIIIVIKLGAMSLGNQQWALQVTEAGVSFLGQFFFW